MAFSAVMTGTTQNVTATNGSNVLAVTATSGWVVGATIQGTGIPTGARVGSIVANTSVTMVTAAGASAPFTGTTGTVAVLVSSKYGTILSIALTASGDNATWQNVFNAGFGLLQGSRELFFPGAMTLVFDTIAAGALFNHQDWTVEYGTGGRQLFDSGKLAGEQRGGYLQNGTQFIKAAGPTFIFNNWNNGTAGGSTMFTNTGGLLTKGGLFRMHNPRFVARSGSNNAFAFVSTRDDLLVENMILDYQYASGSNASIGGGYGVMKNTYVVFANSGIAKPNSTSNATIDGLFYVGLYGDSPNHKFAIPNNYILDGYAPQVLSTQLLGGFQDNTTETFSNINLSTAGWGLEDLKTKYRRYGGPNEIRFPRTVAFQFKDSAAADLTGVTLYISSGGVSVVNEVQAGDYSALTQALVLNWTSTVASYRAPNTITDTINQVAQIRKYGYQQQSVAYSLNLAPYSQPFFMLDDVSLSGIDEATAAAITTAGINWSTKTITPTGDLTYDQINARMVWELAQTTGSANTDPRTLSGTNLTLATGWSLVVNTGVTLSSGSKFSYIYVPTITLNGSGAVTGLYESTTGKSTIIEQSGVTAGSSIYVGNNATGITKQFVSNTSASIIRTYFAPNETADQLVVRELYGSQRVSQVVSLTGGLIKIAYVDIPDVGISEANKATVAAYSTLETNSKLKDYISLKRLEEAFIKLGEIAVRDGTSINFGNYSGKIKSTATALLNITGNLITVKANGLAGDSKYSTIVATPPATWTADTTENLTTNIEDGGGDSSVNITASGVSTFEVWKITDATNPDNYATGTLLGTVGIGKYRFLHADGYKMVIRDTTTNFRVVSEMEKGIYEAALFFGAAVQLAQAAEVTQINTKVDTLQVEISNVMQNFDVSYDSLHAISQEIQALPTLSAIEGSTVLAKESVLDAAKAKIDTMVSDVWSATSRTLTSAGSSGATLAEIEASPVLAKQATSQAIKDKVDTLNNPDLSNLATHHDAIVINDGVKAASLLIPHDTDL